MKNKFIVWSNALNTGNPKIDKQHQGIVDTINELYDCVSSGIIQRFNSIVEDLVSYSIHHLMEEEELMEVIGFPDIEKHREYHNALRKQTISAKSDELKNNSDKQIELLHFLKAWWINHISNEDRKYVPYLK